MKMSVVSVNSKKVIVTSILFFTDVSALHAFVAGILCVVVM